MRHIVGCAFGMRRPLTAEKLIDRRIKQIQPPPETRPIHLGQQCQICMNPQRIPAKPAIPKQHTLPEVTEPRNMKVPVNIGHLVEDGTQQFIHSHLVVKAADQELNIRSTGDIWAGGVGHLGNLSSANLGILP